MKVCHWRVGRTAFISVLAALAVLVMVAVLVMKTPITKEIPENVRSSHGQEENDEALFKLLTINETDSKAQQDLKLSLQNSSKKLEEHLKQNSGSCLRKIFSDILLVVVYNFPFYESFPGLRHFYNVAFDSIIICGSTSSDKYPMIQVDHNEGFYAYQCLAQAIVKFPGFQGYMYINDDMIVNWWNFQHFSKSEIWSGSKIENGVEVGQPPPSNWMWWSTWLPGMKTCEDSFQEIQNIADNNSIPWFKDTLNVHLENHQGAKVCRGVWSDFFYIPGRLADKFQTISNIFYKHKVFLEIAVPTILTFLDRETHIEYANGFYLPTKYGFLNFSDGDIFWKEYKFMLYFIHPFKFHSGNFFSRSLFRTFVVPYSYKQGYAC